jgi:hypothetical protein
MNINDLNSHTMALKTLCPCDKQKLSGVGVKFLRPPRSAPSFLSNAFTSLDHSSNCLAKRAFTSVKVSTTPWSAAVAVARFDSDPIVDSTI